MAYVMLFFVTALVVVTMSYSEAKFPYWGMDEDLERQSCPNPPLCTNGVRSCNSQNCPSGQKCCIDVAANRACCVATVVPTTTVAFSVVPACTLPGSTCQYNLANDVDSGVAQCESTGECYLLETCCRVGQIPIGCCVRVPTRPPGIL